MSFVLETYRADPEGNRVRVDDPQASILRAVAQHDRVAVRSSHGIGKTTTAAWLTAWWLATRGPAALVVTAAGTWNHLQDKLWPEINTWSRSWLLRDAFEWQEMGIYSRTDPHSWRAEASSSDQAENVEGFHSPNLLLIIDEAKAMSDGLFAAIRGAMTQCSAAGAKPKIVVLSTPPLTKGGWYADLFGSKSEGWALIHVSASESPRVSREWVEDMRRDFGEGSATYQAKVLGDIPEGAASAVVQGQWIEAAQLLRPPPDRRPVVVTCDVAREGEDLTVIGRIKDSRFSVEEWKGSNDTMEASGMCLRRVKLEGAKLLVVDDTGVGGGVTDRLRELQYEGKFPKDCAIIGEKFGAAAGRDDRFHLRKDELWWAARDALKSGRLALQTDEELAALQLPRGSSLKAQLSVPIYEEDSQSRIRVLDKRMEGRAKTLGLPSKSPDLAHALILGVKHWLYQKEETEPPPPRNTVEQFEADMREAMKRRHKNAKRPVRRFPGRNWAVSALVTLAGLGA